MFAIASLSVVAFEPSMRWAGVGAFAVCVILLFSQKRTQFVFDPAARTLTIARRGIFGGQSLQMGFSDIQSIDVQVGGAVSGRVTYRAALTTKVGVYPLQTRYESDKADLHRCIDVINICVGGVAVTGDTAGVSSARTRS